MKDQNFNIRLDWNPLGKKFAYKEYSRQFTTRITNKPDLVGTAAPEFFGSPYTHNPEDLLVTSVASCHMLSYLALAANAKIEVLSYHDEAVGTLHQTEDKSVKFSEIILNPCISISPSSDESKAKALHEKAHKICFIANSVNFPVQINPVIKKTK
ncbi:MAG: OsmC family protein [Deltaproteobacteria bacterium]|nr:OsmC family protein [Deltaproteobacteria bacterium]